MEQINLSPTKLRNREVILRAFASLLDEMPYSAIKTQDVITRAKIAKSTFYQYFPHKNELRDSLIAALAYESEVLFQTLKKTPKRELREQRIVLYVSRNKSNYERLRLLEEKHYSPWDRFWKEFLEFHCQGSSFKSELEAGIFLVYLRRLLLDDSLCTPDSIHALNLSLEEKKSFFELFE